MTTAPIQHQPPQQPPVHMVTNQSEQTRRIAVLAIGVLTSAVILAALQPPASIILASVVMLTTLSIAFDSGDHPVTESTTTEKTFYVVRERPSPLWYCWNLPFAPRSDRVPVGTGERNTFHDVRRDRHDAPYRPEPTSWNSETVRRREPSFMPSGNMSGPEPMFPKQNPFEPAPSRATTSVPTSRNRETVGSRESSSESGSYERWQELNAFKEKPHEPGKLTSTDRVPVGRR